MELWIFATLAAAFFQTLRFMLHKVLSMGTLSNAGSTFARFAYALPFAWALAGGYVIVTGQSVSGITAVFWGYALAGATAQILATLCVVAIFAQRNFAVGITFKKTEVVQTALLAFVVLGDRVTVWGWGAIGVGLFGVLLLSKTPGLATGWRALLNRSAGLGLLSGFFFAISAVGYRGASLQIGSDDPVLRAGVTLALVVLVQVIAMSLWLLRFEPGQISAVWSARRTAVWLGFTSMMGSLGWFTAFTLHNAAYVQALGQIELIFSIMASTLFFKERITARELAGMVLLTLSIVLLILFA